MQIDYPTARKKTKRAFLATVIACLCQAVFAGMAHRGTIPISEPEVVGFFFVIVLATLAYPYMERLYEFYPEIHLIPIGLVFIMLLLASDTYHIGFIDLIRKIPGGLALLLVFSLSLIGRYLGKCGAKRRRGLNHNIDQKTQEDFKNA